MDDQDNSLLRRVQRYFVECRDFYGEANIRKAKDYDYYEGKQTWDEAEEKRRDDEGKPTIRNNQINGVVDLIEGLERQTRLDIVAKPRGPRDIATTDSITQGIKFIASQNDLDFKISKAFSHAIKGGVGWILPIKNPNPLEEEIMIQIEGPWRIWVDPNFEQDDLRDARYLLYLKWVDIDVAKAMFPDHADDLDGMVKSRTDYEEAAILGQARTHQHGTDYDDVVDFESEYLDLHKRQVLIIECWRKEIEKIHVMVLPDSRKYELHKDAVKADGTLDPTFLTQEQQVAATMMPGTEVVEGYADKMYRTMFTGDTLLWDGQTPYKHQKFPFIPVWAYKRRTGETYGVVRNLIGAQDEVNVHASQATHILNTVRVFIKKTSPMDRTQVATEAARPDPIFEINGPDDIKIERDEVALRDHIQLAQQSKEDIQRNSGINNELLGLPSDAKSGVAMRERQKQGTMRITSIFDYLRYAKKMLGEQLVSLMAQYWKAEKLARITEEMKFMAQQGMGGMMNEQDPLAPEDLDINQARFNIEIEEAPAFGTYREGQLEALKEMMQTMPFIAQIVAPDFIRASDLPNKEQIAQKIEMGMGMAPAAAPAGAPPQLATIPSGNGDPMAQINAYAQQLAQQGMPPEQIRQVITQMLAQNQGQAA